MASRRGPRRRAHRLAGRRRARGRRARRGGRCRRGAARPCGPGSRPTPGPSSSSSTGSTRSRTRTRVKAGSWLCGSSQASSPSTRHAVTVSSRRTPSSGRTKTPKAGRIPCSDRPPEPRARPSSTVSAWSSRVWPSSTCRAPRWSATCSRTAYLAWRAAASGPSPEVASTSTRAVSVSSTPIDASWPTTRSAWAAEPGWRPWSTVTPTTRRPSLRPSNTTAEASAIESAPPLHATATTSPTDSPASRRRTGSRTAATEGWSVTARGRPTRRGRRSRPSTAGSRARSRRR